MNNAFFNDHYVATMARIGGPIFPRGRQGLAGLIRHIRAGGMAVLLNDQYFRRGAELPFFGQPAPTTLSAAEMALKYGADLIPFYGIRAANGLDFDLVFEAPVPHGDALGMTAALNASLEAQVRAHMGQWFWIHRRWKPERQRSRAEPSTGPGPSA
jgi:KDO2-lipid IV(A) lauroyltransferase